VDEGFLGTNVILKDAKDASDLDLDNRVALALEEGTKCINCRREISADRGDEPKKSSGKSILVIESAIR
jgi:hypothetical protein